MQRRSNEPAPACVVRRERGSGWPRLLPAVPVLLLVLLPRAGAAATGTGARPLITVEGDRTVWHRDASMGEAPLVVGVARRAMAADGDTNLADSDAALRILSRHGLTRGWALFRMGQRALAAADTARADSLLARAARPFGVWQADAIRLRHDLVAGRGDLRGALAVLEDTTVRVAGGPRPEWQLLRARDLAALGDTTAAMRAVARMQSMGAPRDSARPAADLLEALIRGSGRAGAADERAAAKLLGLARDWSAQATHFEHALALTQDANERFATTLDLAAAYRRDRRYAAARAMLRALRVPEGTPSDSGRAAARTAVDRARRLLALADVERAAARPAAADAAYAAAAEAASGALPAGHAYAAYREAVQSRSDLALSRRMNSLARRVLTDARPAAADRAAWELRAGVLSLLLGERGAAVRHFEASGDGRFWPGIVRRRASPPAGDSLLAAVAASDDFEFYTVAARETLGLAPRPLAPASGAPAPDGPAWIREAELLMWLGLADAAGTVVERSIDWQSDVRSNGTFADMGFTENAHWLRAARVAYAAGRPAIGIRLAHRARWGSRHGLVSDLDREAVLPWMYPPAYDSLYAVYGTKQGVDPALLASIGWQESFFDEKAISRAGALGVMQFMPATARLVAGRMGEPAPSQEDLLVADRSIRLGADYFAGLLRQFDGAVPPALAAYNAGPGRARAWIRRANGDTGALFCEVIGFDETINYVKNILGAWQAYRWIKPAWE